MATTKPRILMKLEYADAAEAYLRSLPPEHFMEATAQGTQRAITLASFALIATQRPDFQYFNELLVQYPRKRGGRPVQVVPDNMAVLYEKAIRADGSYDVPLQPVGPFFVLEYVSKHNKRKDYEDSRQKYERDLKVPYYLLFYPDEQELTLFHHTGRRYVSVKPNEDGRYSIPELGLEVGLLDGWVRYWYEGKLVPLPADMQRDLEATRQRLLDEKERAKQEKQRADQEKQRADQEKGRADDAAHQAEELRRERDRERQTRVELEAKLARLHARE